MVKQGVLQDGPSGGRSAIRNDAAVVGNAGQVQFGHAGACARGQGETAADKNAALAAAGGVVPASFDEFPAKIKEVYDR